MAFDILLKNGRIIDGKGNPWFRGDVAVADGRIHAVRPRIQGEAREELDASQYVVCPGFIDAHTHSDYVFFVDPTAQSKVRQGGLSRSGNPFRSTWRRWPDSRRRSTSRR